MDAIPKSAGLVSYIAVTIVMCAITYLLVLNLRRLQDATARARNKACNMLCIWKFKDFKQKTKACELNSSASMRASGVV